MYAGRPNLAVGLGAVVGVLARWAGSNTLSTLVPLPFPIGTLLTNMLGCLLLGAAQTLFLELGSVRRETQLLVSVGVLGGYTTFSTMSVETVALVQAGRPIAALGYQLISLAGGVAAILAGRALVVLLRQRSLRRRP